MEARNLFSSSPSGGISLERCTSLCGSERTYQRRCLAQGVHCFQNTVQGGGDDNFSRGDGYRGRDGRGVAVLQCRQSCNENPPDQTP